MNISMDTKNLSLLSIVVFSSFAMQNPLVDELENANYYSNRIAKCYDTEINHDLIEISGTQNPFELLKKAQDYYYGSNTALGEYVTNFRSNIKKMGAFAYLCCQMWHNRYDAAQVDELWYSWPLKSVQIDFYKEFETIKKLQEIVSRANHRSFSIGTIIKELEEVSNNLKRAITIFEKQALLERIKENQLQMVVHRLADADAQEELAQIEYIYPLIDINKDFKEETGQTLCHALCDAKLDCEKFENILKVFKNKGGFVHEYNADNQTILEYAESKNINTYRAILEKYMPRGKKRVWFYDQSVK
jgi:hypothetical protein